MTNLFECTKCKMKKDVESDFYMHRGYRRKVCKACVILQVANYQKEKPQSKFKAGDKPARIAYFQAYYKAHRNKYESHRASFLARNPDYYKASPSRTKLKTGTLEARTQTQKDRKHA